MLSIEKLKELGVSTDEGLTRCLNNEQFYFRLIGKAMADESFDKLKAAVEAGDLDTAFECAHALKGVTGNLALTQLYQPISEMTELLRSRTDTDYSGYLNTILTRKAELTALC